MAPRRPVARIGEDKFAVRIDANERQILGSLVAELRGAIKDREDLGSDAGARPWPGPAGDPADPVARLYPPAFPDDAEAESGFADLVRPSLDDARHRRLDKMEATLDANELDEAGTTAWLGALNDMRLVLGAQLAIREDDQTGATADDPDATRRVVFDYLGWLVGAFVDALADGLPESGRDSV